MTGPEHESRLPGRSLFAHGRKGRARLGAWMTQEEKVAQKKSTATGLLKNSRKPNGTPACAGVTALFRKFFSIKTTVMLAEASIPFSCFHSSSPSRTVFQQTASPFAVLLFLAFLLAPAAANAACANPAGVAGDQIYSSNYNVMQYCNGSSWVNMGSGSFLGEIIANNFCRANPTATQVDCNVAAINLATQVTGNLPVAHLNSGTDAGATTFWRGDGTWAIPQTATAGSAGSLTNPQNFSITGDATAPAISFDGTAPVALSATVVKLQGRTLASTAPTDKQVLVWNNTSSQWEPGSVGPMLSGTAASPGLYFAESPTTGLYRPAADSLGIATGGAARLIVSATGSVGIGTVAPAVALDIGSKADAVRVPVGASGDRPSGLVGMIRYNTSTNQFEGFQGGTTPAWAALGSTYWGSLTANSFCRVDATGTVVNCTIAAIDLASMVTGNLPVTNLASGSGASATTFWRGDGTWAEPELDTGIYLGPSTAAPNPSRQGEANTGLFSPATGVVAVSSLGAEALRVTATGSVGIGTTAPSYPLHVVSSGSSYTGYFSGIAGVRGEGTTSVGVSGVSADSWGGIFSGYRGLHASSSSASVYAIQGQVTQSNSWAVIGSGASCTGWLGYGSYSAGGSCGTSFSSDERLKKEITPVESGLDIVMKLRPVSFLWKSDGKNHELVTNQKKKAANYGFIAQEVMKVLPDLVTETPPELGGLPKPDEAPKKAEKKEPMYGLDYNGFIAPTVAAVQELNAKLEKMKAENDALKAQNAAFEKQLREQAARLKALEERMK